MSRIYYFLERRKLLGQPNTSKIDFSSKVIDGGVENLSSKLYLQRERKLYRERKLVTYSTQDIHLFLIFHLSMLFFPWHKFIS